MLKACCDCIAAGIREERDVYGSQLNGNSLRAPLWPEQTIENEKMFLLPTQFNNGDQIVIKGKMNINPQRFSVSLAGEADNKPDYRNISCHIEFSFPNSSGADDSITLKAIKDGTETVIPNHLNITSSELFSDPNFLINLQNKNSTVDFYVQESYIGAISKESDGMIKYLIVNGDVAKVEKLEFEFA